MPDGLTAALGQIRNRAEQITRDHDPAECIRDLGGTCTGHDAERLLAVADEVLKLHRPFRIYEECEHPHAYESGAERDRAGVIDCGDFVTCEPPLYTVCAECCTDVAGEQLEECAAAHHDHGACWPCPTVQAISRALLSKDWHPPHPGGGDSSC